MNNPEYLKDFYEERIYYKGMPVFIELSPEIRKKLELSTSFAFYRLYRAKEDFKTEVIKNFIQALIKIEKAFLILWKKIIK